MTLLRTLGFTAIVTLLATIVIAPSFMESALFISVILVSLAGFALAQFFSHGSSEEQVEMTSIIFLTLAVFDIILGTLTNMTRQFGTAMAAIPNLSTSPTLPQTIGHAITGLFGTRLVLVELLILFLGLFGPLLISGQLSKHKLPLRQVLLNLVAVALLYLLSTGIVLLINHQLAGVLAQ